nr:selenide, water dikinase SelD [Candidatus Freyrarchaeum guaymaensis]
MGATEIVGFLAILGVPPDMPIGIAVDILRGIKDYLEDVGASCIGGHTIFNPWPLSGGEVTAVAHPDQIVYQSGARGGDVLVLTKPLGTQPAMAVYRAMKDPVLSEEILKILSRKEAEEIVEKALKLMTSPNKPVAESMQEVKPNAATDITGFGLVGHARNMARESGVDLEINCIPVIKGSIQVSELFGYGLEAGESAETSGGMLVAVPPDKLDAFISSLKKRGVTAYVIGNVKEGNGKVTITPEAEVVEV